MKITDKDLNEAINALKESSHHIEPFLIVPYDLLNKRQQKEARKMQQRTDEEIRGWVANDKNGLLT